MKLSVIMPVFNEEKTLPSILNRIFSLRDIIETEVIIVNDGSTDATGEYLRHLHPGPNMILLEHKKTLGKGAAIRTARGCATGEVCIIQDADLEYDPSDYIKLLEPIRSGRHLVVYGCRTLDPGGPRPSFMKFFIARTALSVAANILYAQRLTDEPTCYKAFETRFFKSIPLNCKGFEFCPEVTAKVSKRGIKIIEIPVRYTPRTHGEGKKIRWTDGVIALWTLLKYRFVD